MPGFTVEQSRGQVSVWQGETHHSAADRDGISLAGYIHAMYGLILQAKSKRVLMIGCGGGTLATMLRRADITVIIVDTDARAFAIARRYFKVPDDVACHTSDGAAFLRRDTTRYDAIVFDAYADDNIPKQFLKPAFFALAKSRLAARGAMFLMNVVVADDKDLIPQRITHLLRTSWRKVRLLDDGRGGYRNAVALAGAVDRLKRPKMLMPPRTGAKDIKDELQALKFMDL
ncbi:MAG TPA: fused MFS/spermidine synthase [Rhizomicrobium sp.]|jgi:spermidine synthase